MATAKPSKPNVTLPESFGGVKTPYSNAQIRDGYQVGVPQVVDGGNVNFEKDALFQNNKYLRTVADALVDMPIGKVLTVDSNNRFEYQTQIDDNTVLHKTGSETISGEKIFIYPPIIKQQAPRLYMQITDVTKGTLPSNNSDSIIAVFDSKGLNQKNKLGHFYVSAEISGAFGIHMEAFKPEADSNARAGIAVIYPASGNPYTSAPASDVNNSIVTTVNKSKAANGYFKLGNGLIIQWGHIASASGNTKTVTFPTAFSSTNYYAHCNMSRSGSTSDGWGYTKSKTTTNCMFTTSSEACDWIAIGY